MSTLQHWAFQETSNPWGPCGNNNLKQSFPIAILLPFFCRLLSLDHTANLKGAKGSYLGCQKGCAVLLHVRLDAWAYLKFPRLDRSLLPLGQKVTNSSQCDCVLANTYWPLRTCFPLAVQKSSLVPQPFAVNTELSETPAVQTGKNLKEWNQEPLSAPGSAGAGLAETSPQTLGPRAAQHPQLTSSDLSNLTLYSSQLHKSRIAELIHFDFLR